MGGDGSGAAVGVAEDAAKRIIELWNTFGCMFRNGIGIPQKNDHDVHKEVRNCALKRIYGGKVKSYTIFKEYGIVRCRRVLH